MKKLFDISKRIFTIIQKVFIGLGAVMLVFLVEHVSKNDLFVTPDWIKWSLYWILVLFVLFLIGHAIKDFEQRSRGVK